MICHIPDNVSIFFSQKWIIRPNGNATTLLNTLSKTLKIFIRPSSICERNFLSPLTLTGCIMECGGASMAPPVHHPLYLRQGSLGEGDQEA